MNVLLVEGEAHLSRAMTQMLNPEGVKVTETDLAEDALDLAKRFEYQAIILDGDQLEISALKALRTLRAARVVAPVIVLSADAAVASKVEALNAGADDYLTKPFHKDELLSRLLAIVRRSQGHASPKITAGNVTFDFTRKVVTVDGRAMRFTPYELRILEILTLRTGALVTKAQIFDAMYGHEDGPNIKIVDVLVCKIRTKLRVAEADARIETIWAHGYKLVAPEAQQQELFAGEEVAA